MSQTIQCQQCTNPFIADPAQGSMVACPHCGMTYQFTAPAAAPSQPPVSTAVPNSPPIQRQPPVPPPHAGQYQPPQQPSQQAYRQPPPKPAASTPNRGILIASITGGAVLLVVIGIVAIFFMRRGETGFSVAENSKEASVGDNEFAKSMSFVQLPSLTGGMNDETSVLNYSWKNNSAIAYDFEFSMSLDGQSLSCNGTNSLTPVSTPPGQIFDAETAGSGEAYGTCFFIHPDGLAVTCEHVVRDASSVKINYKGRWHTAQVVSIDEVRDIALIKVNLKNLPVLPVNPDKDLKIGQNVHVIGYPLNDMLGNSVKFNSGTLAGINDRREATEIQLNATVNPGNSGGPIVNQSGQVIGIATALLDGEGIASVAIGIHSRHLEDVCRRNMVKIPFQNSEKELKTVDLAGHATPAVCLVNVKKNANRKVVNYQSSFDVRSSSSSTTKTGSTRGQLLTDRRGEMLDIETEQMTPILFFSPGQIGLEKLGSTLTKHWQSQSLVLMMMPDTTESSSPLAMSSSELVRRRMELLYGRGAAPAKKEPKLIPALESKVYKIESESDSKVSMKVEYVVQTLIPDSEGGTIEVEMKGDLEFDKLRHVISSSTMKGHITLESKRGKKRIPTSLSYRLRSGIAARKTPPTSTATGTKTRSGTSSSNNRPSNSTQSSGNRSRPTRPRQNTEKKETLPPPSKGLDKFNGGKQ